MRRGCLIFFSLRSHLLDGFEVTDSDIIFLLLDVWHFHWDAFMLLFYIVVKYKRTVINLRGRIAFVHIFCFLLMF